MEQANTADTHSENCDDTDPIFDIIDFLVRCAEISFKNSNINQPEITTKEKIEIAYKIFKQSPVQFLTQFGKFLSPNHLHYFENVQVHDKNFQNCVSDLKLYFSDESTNKRIRNRRYKALQKLQQDTDYFSEKQMMLRNPLLYEQLIGQYLTDEEIRERDAIDSENLTFLTMILDTVDRNEMREKQNRQMHFEDEAIANESLQKEDHIELRHKTSIKPKQWGDFDIPDNKSNEFAQPQKQILINANERNLLREEFLHEMYSSFIEGRDIDFDYNTVDNNEEYDDLQQISQDAEDKYFDSEENDVETLEAHMHYVNKNKNLNDDSDPLDIFMEHIKKKLSQP